MSGTQSSSETARGEAPVVLVVDDDEDLADTCEYWLRDEHYAVRTAYDGEQAMSVIDDDVDVILLDRRMPSISGDEVLDRIREQGYDCKVAMMTAVEPDTDLVDMPFDDYLVKPVSRSKIQSTVDELVARTEFDEEIQEYFALDAAESVLESQDPSELRDPGELETLREEVDRLREGHEDVVEQRRAELDRLTRINTVIRDIDAAIVDADDREELESAVCEAVVSAEPYFAAAIVEYATGIDVLRPNAVAGVDGLTEEALSDAKDLVSEAIDEGEDRVDVDVSEAQYRAVADEDTPPREDVSVIAVPLTYRDTVYGALLVYVHSPVGLGENERDVFSEIGENVGNGINSIESRQLLFADRVVELAFDHGDPDDPLVGLAGAAEGDLELEGFAPGTDDDLSCYVTLPGADSDDVLSFASGDDRFSSARTVSTDGDPLFEVAVSDGTILHALKGIGATVDEFELEGGSGRVVAVVAPEADLSAITETVTDRFPNTNVVAKREVERSVQSTDSFRDSLEERLTDRQQSVLEATYNAGYFEWPRESNAEEVAESLGISPPTLHEHLRAAERKLLEAFYDEVDTDGDG